MKDDETVPTVSCDYAYMSDTGSRDKIPNSRPHNESIRRNQDWRRSVCSSVFCWFLTELGWRRSVSVSDGEYSLFALKNAVRDAMPDVEMIPKESLVSDHDANGEAENAVKEIKKKFVS